VHVVVDAPVDFLGLPSNVTPASIEVETSAPVDDILVATSAAGFCFINEVKPHQSRLPPNWSVVPFY